mgnify:CR=1 FL=1
MSALTPAQTQALRTIVGAVTEAIAAAGETGAPGGVLYAALMSQGCTLSQFESLMGALCRTGRIVKRGECYYAS